LRACQKYFFDTLKGPLSRPSSPFDFRAVPRSTVTGVRRRCP
jgi:hypothetical protein